MRTRRVNRYYCDFCKRGGCSAYHMRRHEQGCTANPHRVCGLCAHAKMRQEPIEVLMEPFKAIPVGGEAAALAAVRKLAEGCPACILAAIRQSKVQRPPSVSIGSDGIPEVDDEGCSIDFDFKAELAAWWKEENTAHADYRPYY